MSFRRSLTIAFLLLALLLSSLIFVMKQLADAHERTAAAEHLRFQSFEFASHIRYSSDAITALLRSYINTGDHRFLDWRKQMVEIRKGTRPRPLNSDLASWYWNIQDAENAPTGPPKSLEAMIDEFQFSEEEKGILHEALREYDQAADFEQTVIDAIEQNRIPQDALSKAGENPMEWARRQVFSEQYRVTNTRIMNHIDRFRALMDQRTSQEVEMARKNEKSYILIAWALGLLATAVCVCAYIHLTRHVLQPVNKLVAQSNQIALGKYSNRAVVSGCSELQTLASSFNAMAGSIETDIAKREAAEHALQLAKHEVDESYQLIKSDLQAAARVQQSLLPEIMPDVPGLSFAFAYKPCEELGGDTLNVLQMDEKHIVFYLVDVSGHGVQAALLASTLSHVLSPVKQSHSILWNYHPESGENELATPNEVAQRLNKRFPFNEEVNQYFTIHYGILDVETLHYCFVSAGHPRPVLLSSGKPPEAIRSGGAAIGLLPDPVFKEVDLQLTPGDRLFFFSDGVLEATNPEGVQFQEAALFDSLTTIHNGNLHNGLQKLLSDVQQWANHTNLDDISAMALEVTEKKTQHGETTAKE